MEVHSVRVLVLYLRVNDCDVSDRLDLPELTSIEMGEYAFNGCSRVVFESD